MKKKFFTFIPSLIAALCMVLNLTACNFNLEDLFGNNNQSHTHVLEHVEGKQPTCTQDGNVEYWHCSSCGKDYGDSDARTEITQITLSATGHSEVTVADGENHWQECEICHGKLSEMQPHTSSTYLRNSEEHYKICTECGAKFDVGAHAEGEDCSICGYTYFVETHALEHVEGKQPTCTQDGNLEYWYCAECDRYYADENAGAELSEVTLSAT
ncbi:MAG: hypothetical protein ACI4L9_02510 [Candidatus Coproplasma sp.]